MMSRKTNKTEHVLKLLTSNIANEVVNPILNEEFKLEKIHIRQNSESKHQEEKISKTIKVDILKELVEENIDEVIKRFNVCNSESCKKEIAINALKNTKPIYVNVVDDNYEELKIQKEKYKGQVISNLVKSTIKIKSKSLYNK